MTSPRSIRTTIMLFSDRWSASAAAASAVCKSSGSRRLSCFIAPLYCYTGAMARDQS